MLWIAYIVWTTEQYKYLYIADINECESNPCQHSGLCVDLPNSYQCDCTEGYRGDNCQIGKAVKNQIKQEDSSKYALYFASKLVSHHSRFSYRYQLLSSSRWLFLVYVRDICYAGASRALALSFNFTLRYIADVLSLSNSRLGDFVDRIYPNDFEIKNTTNTARSAPHHNIHLEIVFQ